MPVERVRTSGREELWVSAARLDAGGAQRFREEALGLIPAGAAEVEIDLSRVEFVDSSGLGALVGIRKRLGEGRVILSGLGRPVRRVLEVTGLAGVFHIRETDDDAPG